MSLLHTLLFHVISSFILIIGFMRLTGCVDAAPIVLFEDAHFKGINSTFHIGASTCVNLVGKLSDFYSSVDTMGACFLLCEHQNCRGKCERVNGKLRELATIGLNDLVSSLMLCDEHQETNYNDSSTTTAATLLSLHRRSVIELISRTRGPVVSEAALITTTAPSTSSFAGRRRNLRKSLRTTETTDEDHTQNLIVNSNSRSIGDDDIQALSAYYSSSPSTTTEPLFNTETHHTTNSGDATNVIISHLDLPLSRWRTISSRSSNYATNNANDVEDNNITNDNYLHHRIRRIPKSSHRRKRRRLQIIQNQDKDSTSIIIPKKQQINPRSS